MTKVCGAASSGGHYIELNYHLSNLGIDDCFIVSSKNSQTQKDKRVKYYLKYHTRNPLIALYNFFKSFKIVLKEKPDVIISTGAGMAALFSIAGRILGKKVIHIETLNRITSKSMTGKVMYYFSNYFIVLWPEQLKMYGKNAKYYGLPIVISSDARKSPVKKVFLTVGSTDYPFDRAIKYFDSYAKKNKNLKIFAQIGTSRYSPKNLEYVRFLTYDEYLKKIDWADKVICPPGAGTIFDSLRKSKSLEFIIRLKKYGEAIDDHQYELASKFKDFGVLINNLDMVLKYNTNTKYILNNNNKEFYTKLLELI